MVLLHTVSRMHAYNVDMNTTHICFFQADILLSSPIRDSGLIYRADGGGDIGQGGWFIAFVDGCCRHGRTFARVNTLSMPMACCQGFLDVLPGENVRFLTQDSCCPPCGLVLDINM